LEAGDVNCMEVKDNFNKTQNAQSEDDPWMDRSIMIFLIIFIIAIMLIPSEWLLKWSMWWNNIK
jgi:hypothetical protein